MNASCFSLSNETAVVMLPKTTRPLLAWLLVSTTAVTASAEKRDKMDVAMCSTTSENCTFESVSAKVKTYLERKGITFSNFAKTADGSVIFENLTGNRVAIELYPNGEIIVVIRGETIDQVHQFDVGDLDAIAKLVSDGRLS